MAVTTETIQIEIGASDNGARRRIDDITNALRRLQGQASRRTRINIDTKGANRNVDEAHKRVSKLASLLKTFKRIALMRVIRSIVRSIGQAFSEGLKNAYNFSKGIEGVGGRFARALDKIKTNGNTLKNQLGSAFIGLLTALAPVINAIINLLIWLADVLSQIFAAFTGGNYLKANENFTAWADDMERGAGAAKEWKRQLMGFDEINKLNEPTGGGGGGGASPTDWSSMFTATDLEGWAKKLQELIGQLKIKFHDIFFEWDNLTPEDIVQKVITGLGALLGAGVGFMIGGVGGAIVGTLVGVTLALLINNAVFDNDGVIEKGEVAKLLEGALWGLFGGVIGFAVGGAGGALIGATVGIGIWAILQGFEFPEGSVLADPLFLDRLAVAMTAFTGAAIGFMVGGAAGALIGAVIGIGISAIIEGINFENKDSETKAQYGNGWNYFWYGILGLPTDQEIIDWFSEWWNSIVTGITTGAGTSLTSELYWIFVDPFVQIVQDIKDLLGIHSPSKVFEEIGENMVGGLSDGIDSEWKGFTLDFEGLWNGLKSWWDGLELGAFHIPAPHFEWTYTQASGLIATALEFVGLPATIPHLNISWYAKGGFPEDGLFMANHGELVGEFSNGRTAVANNEQITNGIANAVYDAFMSAFAVTGGNGGNAEEVAIYLDGKEIARTTTKYQQQMARAAG